MYELGYDEKQECANGNRRVGAAIDYMNGKTSYNDIWGDGKVGVMVYGSMIHGREIKVITRTTLLNSDILNMISESQLPPAAKKLPVLIQITCFL